MKRTIAIIPVIAILLSACGAKEEVTDSVEAKMAQIAEYKSEIKDLEIKIRDLEKEIIANGGSLELPPDTVAVTTMTIERGTYEEFVEVAGSVSSDQNILVSSEMGGTVTRIYVKEGQQVSAGQLLLSTDDQVLQKSIDELQNAYDLAKTVYEKRKALWDQKIGSEIEYLTAKNNMESLELKLNTTRTQLAKTQLKSPISGTVDEIITKTGEMASPGMPLLRVVNLSEVQIECDISEAYLGRVKRGDKVNVSFPSINFESVATITNVGQVINPSNRTFKLQVSLNNRDGMLKPNLLGYLQIREYVEQDQVIIPTRLIQNGVNSDFVYAVTNGSVVKIDITRGRSHNGFTQIKSGLSGGEILVVEGNRQVKEGDIARVVGGETASKE
ncbi:MAG: efflux RND transporter periplasmic adaptor subunit [Chitinophagales bacterium]|nr:efflux RND transporter periplasmic adaptor subunit [Chitinophagales bacterium]HPE98670.1 efflux RND transporter periplasmic adaptor subunit [Chitinophagales bacterium]HQU40379.1 efflux RND transporter periplasmic adaptor subunit [Chitinophagales bacterium]HRX24918.1 efflux RND transporter periplasmic adaptor subunit [Chitinophagales bacterium]